MDRQLLTTFAVLIAAIGLLVSERVRPDLVALLVMVALGTSGVLTPREAFSGFSRSAVITIMAIFILAEGLQRTGVTERIGNLLLRAGGKGEGRLVAVVMLAGALLSFWMNNIAAAAVLLPAVSSAARRAGVSPSRLYMPLAFATILGGMATLLTTTNIVVSSLLRDQGLAGYGLLDFAPLGLPIVAVGVAYVSLWGRRLLPASPPIEWRPSDACAEDLFAVYRLGERLSRVRVPAGSPLAGTPLAQTPFRRRYGLNIVAVERRGQMMPSPPPEMILQPGDVLLLVGRLEEAGRWGMEVGVEMLSPHQGHEQDLTSSAIVLVEAVLAPRSGLIGQTLRQAHFRQRYGMTVLAIWRAGRPVRTGLTDLPLQFGDALLLQGPRQHLLLLRSEPDLIVLGEGGKREMPRVRWRGWLALAILVVVLAFVAVSPTLVGEVMLGGALAMVLAGILTMDQAYQAIEWKSVFLVAGMLPLGIAMTKTGAAALLANHLIALVGPAGPLALLVGLFLLTTLLTQTMSGAAVATVVAPMAIQTARHIGADPRAYAMAVALATSMAFITPLGHPVNVLVMGLGGYRFRDYLRVGLPLTLLLAAVVLTLLPLIWPLQAR